MCALCGIAQEMVHVGSVSHGNHLAFLVLDLWTCDIQFTVKASCPCGCGSCAGGCGKFLQISTWDMILSSLTIVLVECEDPVWKTDR